MEAPGANAMERKPPGWPSGLPGARLGLGRWPRVLLLGALLSLIPRLVWGADPVEVGIDFSTAAERLRPLHGINKGPLVAGGLLDLTREIQLLRPPSIRLHDCHWPNPDVVDIHAVFPNPDADPDDPAAYDFSATDEYLLAVQRTGARIVYRLGESIEHTSRKRFVHPPRDPARWARICIGIIRHCNEGWAGGLNLGIRDWEIWNEPENRPAMWTGTDAQYFELYAVVSRALKARFPDLRVGGPAVGATGRRTVDRFEPSAFVTGFLEHCRREGLPLDFFSWHAYSDDPLDLVVRARGLRQVLDRYGFQSTASELNEWNHLPGNSWSALDRSSPAPERERFYAEMSGAAGGAFVAASLLELQEAPVAMANLFHGEAGAFGLFSENGVPFPVYDAVRLFAELMRTPLQVAVTGGIPGRRRVVAGVDDLKTCAGVLIARTRADTNSPGTIRLNLRSLPWIGPTDVEIRRMPSVAGPALHEAGRLSADGAILLEVRPPAVAWVGLRPAKPGKP